MRGYSKFALTSLPWLLSSLLFAQGISSDLLQEYVHAPDPTYGWEVARSQEMENCHHSLLKLTSQSWRTKEEVEEVEWHHWLLLIQPKELHSDTAFLIISGGNRERKTPPSPSPYLIELAERSGAVVAEVTMIPNQAIHFRDEPLPQYQQAGRVEDALIAYTWDRFFQSKEPTWLARFPMTKSVVRAMDAIQEFYAEEGVHIDDFVLSGRSKRGWTAWTTAGCDQRVRAVIPVVADLLNLKASMEQHYCAYGCWSIALRDYEEMSIPERWGSPSFEELLAIVEPIEFRTGLSLPKLFINAAGDEFFLPDSSRFYRHQLVGPTYLRYIPNVGHNLKGSDWLKTQAAFFEATLSGRPLPSFSWSLEGGEKLVLETADRPTQVRLWRAENCESRDFRLFMVGSCWESEEIELDEEGGSSILLEEPEKGWNAAFLELTYDWGGSYPLTFTTDIYILPDTLPYPFPYDKENSQRE